MPPSPQAVTFTLAAEADLTACFGKRDGSTDNDGNAASSDGNGIDVPDSREDKVLSNHVLGPAF